MMIRRIGWIGACVAMMVSGFVVATRIGAHPQSPSTAVIHAAFPEVPTDAKELVALSDAIVRAQPLPKDEILLVSTETTDEKSGVMTANVWARPFRVTEVITGDLAVGDEVLVTRFEVFGAGDQSSGEDFQPPFSAGSYVLGLDAHPDAYKVPVWVPIGGPNGAIPVSDAAAGNSVQLETPSAPLQQRFAGRAVADVIEEIRGGLKGL